MKPPPGRENAADLAGARRRDTTEQCERGFYHRTLRDPLRRTPPPEPAAHSFRVIIIGDRPCHWGSFDTAAGAEACVAKLRRHGFNASVEAAK